MPWVLVTIKPRNAERARFLPPIQRQLHDPSAMPQPRPLHPSDKALFVPVPSLLARESVVSILREQVADLTAVPPSPNVTLDTPINFGVISPPKLIRETVSTIDGDLYYGYE